MGGFIDSVLCAIGPAQFGQFLSWLSRPSCFRWAVSALSRRQKCKWFDARWRAVLANCLWECGQFERSEELFRSAVQEEGQRSAFALHCYCFYGVMRALRLHTPELLRSHAELCRTLLRHPAFFEWDKKSRSRVRGWLAACISDVDSDEALGLFRSVVVDRPDDLFVVSGLGAVLANLRQYREGAEWLCRAAILAKQQKDPWFNAEWTSLLAQCLWECGETERAEEMFRSAIREEGERSAIALYRYCYYRVRRALRCEDPTPLDEAAALCRTLIERPAFQKWGDQYRGQVQSWLGQCLIAGHPDEAEELLNSAIAILPKDGHVLDALGNLAARRGNLQEAIDYKRRAIALDPRDPHYHHNLGSVLCCVSDWHGANEAFTQAVRYGFDKDHKTVYGQALCALELGDPSRAEELARKALDLDPGYDLAVELLSEITSLKAGVSGSEGQRPPGTAGQSTETQTGR